MADHEGGNLQNEVTREEHQHNLKAKRVVLLNGSGGQMFLPLVANVDYDYLDVQQTAATIETFVFKTGGSGGTAVLTVVVTYTSSTKADIDTVVWS